MSSKLKLLSVIIVAIITGCSSGGLNPVTFQEDAYIKPAQTSESRHLLWGRWEFDIDPANRTITPVPLRNTEMHFNITQMLTPPACDDCLSLHINSFDPQTHLLDLDVELYNGYEFTGYDVRGILFTNDAGHELMNPDDWTPLYDIAGGMEINPFKAFAKDAPSRMFAGLATYTENFIIRTPASPQFNLIKFAVDASWPGNATEPYSIDNFIQLEDIYSDTGSSGTVQVDVHDWEDDVDTVMITAPDLAAGWIPMVNIGGDSWQAELVNELGSANGENKVEIKAVSGSTGITVLYDFGQVFVTATHGWARTWGAYAWGCSTGICINGNGEIYITGLFQGTVDFDPGPGVDEHTVEGKVDVFLSKFNAEGDFEWARTWGGDLYDKGTGVAVDESGNVYVTGSFEDHVDFNPGPGENTHFTESISMFLSKFDQSGNLQWARIWGKGWYYWGGGEGIGVTTDGNGDVLVTGYFAGIVDFDPDDTVDEHEAKGIDDLFLCKYGSSGNYQWARTWGGDSEEFVYYLVVDSANNVYTTGYFKDAADLDPSPDVDEHVSNGDADIFLSKLDPSGTFLWGQTWGAGDYDSGFGIAIDGSGNAYVTGYFQNTVDFDPGPGIEKLVSTGSSDAFLSKLDPAGNFQWAKSWGGVDSEYGSGVTIDSNTNIYITGVYQGTTDLDPGPAIDMHKPSGGDDIFLSKLEASGDYKWGRTWGGTGTDRGMGVVADEIGNAYVMGTWDSPVDFDPGPGVDEHVFNGFNGIFLSRFQPDGNW